MADGKPKVSVLIPAYNEEIRISRCLSSIHAAFAAAGEGRYEIIVCDNNSSDGTAAAAEQGGARVVFEPQNQIARARNTAAREAAGEWLIFLDADSELPPALLRVTLGRLSGGRVGAGGAPVAFDTRPAWHGRWGLAVWNAISRCFNLAAGSYIFCLRSAWEETGGFDERFFASEEIDFSRRLKAWCRRNAVQFEILVGRPVKTSARKIESHSPGRMLKTLFRLALPGALRSREACGFWYERREGSKEK